MKIIILACVVFFVASAVIILAEQTSNSQTLERVNISAGDTPVEKSPAHVADVNKSPAGPTWPTEFTFKQERGPVVIGKPFDLTISITPRLFDVSEISLKIVAEGDHFKIIGGETNWVGALKKGQTKRLKLVAVASTNGFCGKHVLIILSKTLYADLRNYIANATEGDYASGLAKSAILTEVEEREKKGTNYIRIVPGPVFIK